MKAAGKDKKLQTGLLVFETIVGAHSAVHGFADSKDHTFKAFKSVTWAGGKEPQISGEQVGTPSPTPEVVSSPASRDRSPMKTPSTPKPAWGPRLSTPLGGGGLKPVPSFASFSSAATPNNAPFSQSEAAQSPDYESITLMRMREAEKRRLEAEIRKRDEGSGSNDAP